MTFRFRIDGRLDVLLGSLVYDPREYSFRFERGESALSEAGVTSLSIGTLQIEVDVASGRVLYVWGLHPHGRWQEGHAVPNDVIRGGVQVLADPPLVSGVSLAVAAAGEWVTTHDPVSGWVHVYPLDWAGDGVQVEVADDTLLGIEGDRLTSLWLKPSQGL